jgi:histone demethylase JARID1
MFIAEVPTIHPTESQFADPIAYLSSPQIAALGQRYGMLKLVPPASFKPPLSINKSKFKFIPRLQKLKELNLLSRCRLFFYKQLLNFNKMMNLGELPTGVYDVAGNGGKLYYYDFFIEVVKYYRAANRQDETDSSIPNISNDVILYDEELWKHIGAKFPQIPVHMIRSIYYRKLMKYFNYLSSKSQFSTTSNVNHTSLLQNDDDDEEEDDDENDNYTNKKHSSGHDDDDDDDDNVACLVCSKSDDPKNTLLCDSCDKPYHKHCLDPPLTKIPNGNWYCDCCILGNGQYGFQDSSFEYSLKDFEELCVDFDDKFFTNGKPNNVKKLEAIFWGLVEDESMNDVKVNYGADIHNLQKGQVSGFPTLGYMPSDLKIDKNSYKAYTSHSMNLNNLPFDNKSLLTRLNVDISGMTIPWIYIGSTFSTFCWHVEDQWTLSANYQHYGAVKKWYGIPSSDAAKLEEFMKSLAPDLFEKQPDILHQLITLVSPFELQKNGIQCYTANQQPGEYIITYPRVYHSGFNTGYNFNEAVNFTMTDWLEFGVESTLSYKNSRLNKASVFDIWELIINILKSYNFNDSDEQNYKVDLTLIEKSLTFMKKKLTDEYQLFSTIKDTIHSKPKIEPSKTPDFARFEKKSEDDGICCSKCKGFCTFFYVKHYVIPTKSFDAPKNYLLTPQSSPDTDQNAQKRRSKRIKIKQDESYECKVLCIEDYLKIDAGTDMDELFIVKDIDEVKRLVKDVDAKYGSL